MRTDSRRSILIIAGESSGEKYGAGVIDALRSYVPDIHFFGIGGKRMKEAGAELLYSVSELALVGIFEIFSHIPRLKRIFRYLEEETAARKPEMAVLIDAPDFNLRLARKLKRLEIPVFYYISPTVWAWRRNRLKTIKKYIDKMLLIFPFEESIYKEHGIPAVFVGHPLLQHLQLNLSRNDYFAKFNFNPQKKQIAFLPGSRQSEIDRHMPVLIKTASMLKELYHSEFSLVMSEDVSKEIFSAYPEIKEYDFKIICGRNYEAMAYSDLVLSACGTATLEAALLETPLIAFYRLHPFTYYLGRPFVHLDYFSIVNILAGEQIVPEYIQHRMTPGNLTAEASGILDSAEIRRDMITKLQRIKQMLGEKNSYVHAAKEMADFFLNQKSKIKNQK
jgi:lipid-A-disaccharide synthase